MHSSRSKTGTFTLPTPNPCHLLLLRFGLLTNQQMLDEFLTLSHGVPELQEIEGIGTHKIITGPMTPYAQVLKRWE
jgi:hypothetical protein